MLPHDPELEPVAAAKAALAGDAPRRVPGPAIAPLDPAAWAGSYILKWPLVVDGEELREITVRRITTAEVTGLVVENDETTSLNLRARALACGLHPEVFGALAAEDGFGLAEVLRPFLPAALVELEATVAEAFVSG